MADKTEPNEPEDQEPKDQEPDQEQFWKRFRDETTRVVDARLAERDKKRADGKRRSDSKRTTVPGMIANLMFGPEK